MSRSRRFKPVRASADLTQCDADALVQKSIENLAFGEDFDHLLPVVYHLYGIIAVIGQPAQKPAGRQVGISGEYTGAVELFPLQFFFVIQDFPQCLLRYALLLTAKIPQQEYTD